MFNWREHEASVGGVPCCVLPPASHPAPFPRPLKVELGNLASCFGKAGCCSREPKTSADVLGLLKTGHHDVAFLFESMTGWCS